MAAGPITARATLAALALVLASLVPGAAAPPPPAPPGAIRVDGSPGGVATPNGGGLLVVALTGRFQSFGLLATYRKTAKGYIAGHSLRSQFPLESVAIAPDGHTIVATTRVGLMSADLHAIERGKIETEEVREGDAPDANQIVFSRDGAYVFFTVQRYARLDVARISAQKSGPPDMEIVARIKLDRSPGGLALSPDGRTLYVTSEADTADPQSVAGASDPQLGRTRCAFNQSPHGVLASFDVANLIGDADHTAVSRVAAGCAPTRVALSPDGKTAWVSVRGENRVVAFDTARLRNDPAHALLASVAVGQVPVGLAVSQDGKTLLVANSNRSLDPDDAQKADLSIVSVAAALAGKPAVRSRPTGSLAREVVALPGGGFLVTDYLAHAIDVLKPGQLRGRPSAASNVR